jgi:hypothetical protein
MRPREAPHSDLDTREAHGFDGGNRTWVRFRPSRWVQPAAMKLLRLGTTEPTPPAVIVAGSDIPSTKCRNDATEHAGMPIARMPTPPGTYRVIPSATALERASRTPRFGRAGRRPLPLGAECRPRCSRARAAIVRSISDVG